MENAKPGAEHREQVDGLPVVPRLIEFVGVAGTGKSTLLRALHERNARIQELPNPNKLFYLPTMLRVALCWLPLYLLKYRHGRWFTLEEIRKLGYLDMWLGYTAREARARDIIIALDPGSICWLVALRDFGPELTEDPRFQQWWQERLNQWAQALDVIIWMEAPIDLSLERVMGRDEEHEAKSLPTEVALNEFERYRLSYVELIPEIVRRGHAKLYHFNSREVSTKQMVDEILAAIGPGNRDARPSAHLNNNLSSDDGS